MKNPDSLVLVTGATGQIGRAVVFDAIQNGFRVRVLARDMRDADRIFSGFNVDIVQGDFQDSSIYGRMIENVTHVCHCAAKVGDWGLAEDYWKLNVDALQLFLDHIHKNAAPIYRFVHMSSLGVYEPRDHFGTDESVPLHLEGLDAYNQTKAAAEKMILGHPFNQKTSTIVLRPGFVYGPGDRHILPALVKALKQKKFMFIGNGDKKMDQIAVANVAQAALLALTAPQTKERVFNITDDRLVTRKEFVQAVASYLKVPEPQRSIPESLGKTTAFLLDRIGRTLTLKEPPVLSKARYKFLALNLEFSINRAKSILGYAPKQSFQDGIKIALESLAPESVAV